MVARRPSSRTRDASSCAASTPRCAFAKTIALPRGALNVNRIQPPTSPSAEPAGSGSGAKATFL